MIPHGRAMSYSLASLRVGVIHVYKNDSLPKNPASFVLISEDESHDFYKPKIIHKKFMRGFLPFKTFIPYKGGAVFVMEKGYAKIIDNSFSYNNIPSRNQKS